MSTILFAPATFNLAETTRMIEVAKVLRQEHRCIFCGYSEKYADIIREAGFDLIMLEPVLTPELEQQIMAFDQMKSLKNPFDGQLVKERVVSELALIETLSPQVIVTGTNVTIFLSARISKVPLVYVKPITLSRPHFENADESHLPSQLRQPWLPRKQVWRLMQKMMLGTKYQPAGFKKVEEEYGLRLPPYVIDLFDGDLNLITTSAVFIADYHLPAHYLVTGPIFAQLPRTIPEKVLSAIEKARSEGRKIVYLALGSSGNRKLAERLLAYFAEREELVIAPLTVYFSEEDRQNLPEQICLVDWLPALEVSRLVDFSVIHGGEGTVQTACHSGKPFIGIGLQYEQEINVKFCEDFGNGLALSPRQVKTAKLDQTISRIQEPQFLQKAQEMQRLMAQTKGAEAAAQIIRERYC